MKTYIFSLALGIIAVTTTLAQNHPKVRKDVTYSTHNYKHPNKAAAARQWSNAPTVTVDLPEAGNARVANYKQPVSQSQPGSALAITHTPNLDPASRNYKIQHRAANAGAKRSTELADKPEKVKSDTF